jgi:hypothetical protein
MPVVHECIVEGTGGKGQGGVGGALVACFQTLLS